MVAFLAKPAESEGFEQIVDFLNANPIRYALTINPTIYTSCIEQFWATVKTKTVNGEVQLQALVYGKKIIVTEASVRSELQLNDEEGMDYFPNATIFEELTRIWYEKISQKLTFYKAFFSPQWKFLIHTILQCLSSKTIAWNEFSSTMTSAIICFATNQKFNFSKYIFESMVKNLDNVSRKFLMYPRFVQVFLDKQLEGMQSHKRIYDAPSHTKKIFGNMKRVGKGFSGRVTPLFPTMVVQAQEEIDEAVNEEMDDSLVRARTMWWSRHQETMGDTIDQTRSENVSKFSNDLLLARVIDLEKIKTSQAQEITSLKRRVKRLEKKKRSRTHGLKRLYKVGLSRRVESSDEEGLGEEDASKQGRIVDIDADAGINLVSTHFDADTYMFGVHDLVSDEVVVESEVAVKAASTIPVSAATTTTTVITDDEITLLKHCCTEQTDEKKRRACKEKAHLAGEKIFVVEQGVPNSKKNDVVSTAGVATTVSAAATIVLITPEEITLAQALKELKIAKPKVKGIVFKEPVESTTTTTISSQQPSHVKVQDKELVEGSEVRVKAEIAQESSSKRASTELEQESIKKQKVDEDKETTKLQRPIEIVLDKEEVAIDAIPFTTKPPSIVDYKIHKEGKKTYYQIIRADGSSKLYLVFSHMLKSFHMEDLETLWKLVKAKHGSTRPDEGYERVLWGDLKTMFDPHVEDQVWRNQHDYKVLDWKIYDSCGVHSLRM
ncbi:hypothetical protein Tco_0542258 [Tanacetum coccineum]